MVVCEVTSLSSTYTFILLISISSSRAKKLTASTYPSSAEITSSSEMRTKSRLSLPLGAKGCKI